MPYLFGTDSTTIIFKSESHKLHEEFEVRAANPVSKGQLVALHTDGTVFPLAVGDNKHLCIGYSLHDGAAGDLVTVVMKGYGTIFMEQFDANNVTPGPVTIGAAAVNAATGYVRVDGTAAGTAVNMIGWALDVGTAAEDVVRVVVSA